MSEVAFKIPTHVAQSRIRDLLLWIAKNRGFDLESANSGGRTMLAWETGIPARRIWAILNLEGPSCTVGTLETIINTSNELDLRWMSPEEGGFADVFEGVPQNIPPPTPAQAAKAKQGRDKRAARERRNRAERRRELIGA